MAETHKKRIVAFDFIRIFAILMVVLSHTLKVGDIPFDIDYLGILGNVLFFFISGYLIYLNNSSITSKKDVLHFYKKRILRIYPLYLLSFAIFVALSVFIGNIMQFGNISNYSPFEIVANVLGLQMVFYPSYITHMALWFIGMIIIFYLIYPIAMCLSQQKAIRYLICSCIAIGALAILKIFTGFIGGGVFEYYFVFVAGVLFSWIDIFKSKYMKLISIFSFIIFGICLIITQILHPEIRSAELTSLNLSIAIDVGLVFILRIIYGISAVFVLYTIFNWIKPSERFSGMVVKGAFAAYAVYLFHGQYFTIINKLLLPSTTITSEILLNPALYDILLICILIPIIFVIAYYIQKGENTIIGTLKSKIKQKTTK